MPIWTPKSPNDDGLRPIDVLYGCYKPETRSIEIFINRINRDAKEFSAEPDELLEIVRIHEHAHAVIHIGCRSEEGMEALSRFGTCDCTDWPNFVQERTIWCSSLPTEAHELLAQAITYAALSKRSNRLLDVFVALESKQLPHYRLADAVKQGAIAADWPLVLDAARGRADVPQGAPFKLTAGLQELIGSYAP